MVVTKPADFRAKQKEFFQKAYEGDVVVISRPRNENVVIISADDYNEMKALKRFSAYCDGFSEFYDKITNMVEDDLSESDLRKMFSILQKAIKQKKEKIFAPMTKEEMLEKLTEARKHAEEGQVKPADQVYEEMRILYGL